MNDPCHAMTLEIHEMAWLSRAGLREAAHFSESARSTAVSAA